MKDFGGIQSLFDNAIVPVPGGKGDMASSAPGVPISDAPSATETKAGPMTLTMTGGGLDHGSAQAEGSKIKGS